MKRLVMTAVGLCLVAGSWGGVIHAQTSGFDAEFFSNMSSQISPSSNNLSHQTSVLNDVTFGNFETPYDFLFQPWELPQIAFPQTWHLGNKHEAGEEGDYKSIYWSQLSNNGATFNFSPFVSGFGATQVDVLSAAWLGHVGGGFLGVAGSFGTEEFETQLTGSVDERQIDLTELYVTYGRRAGTLDWGVGVTLYGASVEDSATSGGSTDTAETDFSNLNVKGGVKLKGNEDMVWSFFGQFGQPSIELDEATAGNPDLSLELDGDTIGFGAALNLYKATRDWEFELTWDTTSYDIEGLAGPPLTSFLSDGEVDEDVLTLRARSSWVLGKAHVYEGIRFVSSDSTTDTSHAPSSTSGRFEFEDTIIEPSIAVKFPLTCQECWLSVNLLAGAAYTYFDNEDSRSTPSSSPDPTFFNASSTSADTSYRLGLEARADSFVFELMWQDNPVSTGINRDQVLNDVWTAALSLKW